MEKIKEQVKKILMEKSDKSVCETVKLIEKLAEIANEHDEDAVEEAFDAYFNYDMINYVSEEAFEKIDIEKKWSKSQIEAWLKQNSLDDETEWYNINALVVGMNYEFFSHKNFIEKIGNEANTAYRLADEALQREGYIEGIKACLKD